MFSKDMRNNLYRELELQLDNKQFFNANEYYKSNKNSSDNFISESNMTYIKTPSLETDYTKTVKGISFSNKIDEEKKTKSINDLSLEDRKIYKIADLLDANLDETIIINYRAIPTSLALVKKYEWKEILFSDLGTIWGIIKNKFN